MKKIVVSLFIVVVILFFFVYRNRVFIRGVKPTVTPLSIDSFEECAKKYPVMESYPRQCRIPEGRLFVEAVEVKIGDCIVTGCSSQVCADHDVITTCEFLPEYACYRNAVCERQSDGTCGWTETEELLDCLGTI